MLLTMEDPTLTHEIARRPAPACAVRRAAPTVTFREWLLRKAFGAAGDRQGAAQPVASRAVRGRLAPGGRPHLRRDWAHPCHICAGTGRPPLPTRAGLGSPPPLLRRDWAHPATSAPGPALAPCHIHIFALGLSVQVTRDLLSGARWMDVTASNVRSALPVRPRRRRRSSCRSRSPPLGTHQYAQAAKCARPRRRWW